MDSVLTRKLFRDKYFQLHKPKKFNKGGITSIPKFQTGGFFTPQQEKAILGFTVAQELLEGKQSPGRSNIRGALADLSRGITKLPEAATNLAKARPKAPEPVETIIEATAFEKKSLGYDPKDRLVVKVKGGNVTGIADKPTAGERKSQAAQETTINTAKDVLFLLDKTGDPTGKIGGVKIGIKAYLGNKDLAELSVKVQDLKKSAIQALRGAQVGPAEEASFEPLLPSVYDSPNVIRTKVEQMVKKLSDINNRLSPTSGSVDRQLSQREIVEQYQEAYKKLGIGEVKLDPNLTTYDFDADGNLIEVK